MRYLADTHILLWIAAADIDDMRLSSKAKEILTAEDTELYYSFINIWEVALKRVRHPEKIRYTAEQFEQICQRSGISLLETKTIHAIMMETLHYDREAAKEDHNDPFDRILLAQAKAEGFRFLTHDHLIPFYREPCTVKV